MFPTHTLIDPLFLPDNTLLGGSPPDYYPPPRVQQSVSAAFPSETVVSPLQPAPGPSRSWLSDTDSSETLRSSDSELGEDGELPSIATLLRTIEKPKVFEVQFLDRAAHSPLVETAWKQTARLYNRARSSDDGKRHKLRLATARGEAASRTVERPVLHVARPVAKIAGTALVLADITTYRGLEPPGHRRNSRLGRPLITTLKDNTFCMLPANRKNLILPQLSWIQLDHIMSTTLALMIFKGSHLALLSFDEGLYEPVKEATLHQIVALMNKANNGRPPTFKQKVKNFFSEMAASIRHFLRPY